MGEGFKVQRQSPAGWDGTLYKAGDEYASVTGGWIAGYSDLPAGTTYSQTKETDHLKIALSRTVGGASGRMSWITTNPINLIDFSKLRFDWIGMKSDVYDDPLNTQYAIQVVTAGQKISNELIFTASYGKTFQFSRETAAEINVSALTGDYYIRFIMRVVNERNIEGKLYSIKGVK